MNFFSSIFVTTIWQFLKHDIIYKELPLLSLKIQKPQRFYFTSQNTDLVTSSSNQIVLNQSTWYCLIEKWWKKKKTFIIVPTMFSLSHTVIFLLSLFMKHVKKSLGKLLNSISLSLSFSRMFTVFHFTACSLSLSSYNLFFSLRADILLRLKIIISFATVDR